MSRSIRSGFIAGVGAGGIATAAIYLGLFTSGIPAVALALWDRMLRAIPMEVFSYFIVRLKFAAKPSAFWGMLLGIVVLWGVLGALLVRVRPWPRLLLAWAVSAGVLALLTWGPASATLAARHQALGAADGGTLPVALAIAGYATLYALVYAVTVGRPPRPVAAAPKGGVTRREVLTRGLLLFVAAAAGASAARWMSAVGGRTRAVAQSLFARVRDLPPEITPTDQFYVVSKNPPGFDPVLNADRWSLEVGGLVARPLKLGYEQLRQFPSVEQFQTLECISNEVGGDLIGNARWKGARLRDILQQAGGPGAKAVKVAFRCADGYTESIPIADALNPTTLLAYEMNGEPLPPRHGFPVRLLVPGLFGMKNPKWITRIEVVDYDFQGYWERSGWSDEAVVKTMSKFTTLPRTVAPEEVPLGGVAYAGDRGVREVEVSTDGGRSWQKAEVKPALGPFTWVLWAALWKPTGPGEYTLKVRAKDGGGVLQTAKEAPPLPDGASGYHTLRVRVRN
ncbi:MAG: molybdopterin-dependent oxidoreductase [Armatimonadota bacterium]|nr:molybdopterin-dependent oxidoreductase [Armatimonadota bacterium]MDR7451383.1 molybdopterin-dependent oxidoreductase [Armatimonadota bacterium]MDR7466467.1 molybdopterin-dependent oxidoreductase [Armatimonadota bacterium]MDR7493189.1 molybdopterin-dependent oxidoreductase [Armatimonadota bacterium]MDR7499458.1 molybdopterin-dependent oxidoreductase [Armatimonadota bacterium]